MSADAISVVASTRAVVLGRLTPATIAISQTTGKIVAVWESVRPETEFPAGTPYQDYSPHVLLPGLVDAHVHLNEPGRTEWEGFYTGTQAAAFGGVTTVIDMPLNAIPPTTTVAGLHEKIRAAQGKCWVDVGFYGGVIPGNAHELKALVREGVRGFKGFLIDSGVEEFPAVTADDISKAMVELADEPTTLMFHAEMVPPITASVGDEVQKSDPPAAPSGPLQAYSTFLDSRPSSFETYAIAEIVSLAEIAPKLPLHIVHLSAMEAIPLLREARANGVPITAETCFHYLSLASEEIREGDTRHKCCPPIRSQSNQDALWTELERYAAEGVIKTVVSDHSPCTPDLKLLPSNITVDLEHKHAHTHACADEHENEQPNHKKRPPLLSISTSASLSSSVTASAAASPSPTGGSSDTDMSIHEEAEAELAQAQKESIMTVDTPVNDGNFFSAWGGISSVGLGLPILWTEISRRKNLLVQEQVSQSLQDVVQWCAVNTAKQVGLENQKGMIAVGYDADICVFDDAAEWVVEPSTMLFRNKCSPYQGRTLKGMVLETWLRGEKIFSRGSERSKTGFFDMKKGARGRLLLERRV